MSLNVASKIELIVNFPKTQHLILNSRSMLGIIASPSGVVGLTEGATWFIPTILYRTTHICINHKRTCSVCHKKLSLYPARWGMPSDRFLVPFGLLALYTASAYSGINYRQSCHHLCGPFAQKALVLFDFIFALKQNNTTRRWCCSYLLGTALSVSGIPPKAQNRVNAVADMCQCELQRIFYLF